MPCRFRRASALLIPLATALYLVGAAADPLLHAHPGPAPHAHAADPSACAADDTPREGHDPASCPICRLSAAPPLPGDGRAGDRPRETGSGLPRAGAPRIAHLAHLTPAPRGPPHD